MIMVLLLPPVSFLHPFFCQQITVAGANLALLRVALVWCLSQARCSVQSSGVAADHQTSVASPPSTACVGRTGPGDCQAERFWQDGVLAFAAFGRRQTSAVRSAGTPAGNRPCRAALWLADRPLP